MEQTDITQTHHLITDFKSLEDESLTLLGLDVDEALKNAKNIGIKIKQRNVILQSSFAIIILALVIGIASYLTFKADDTDTKAASETPKVKTVKNNSTQKQSVDEAPLALTQTTIAQETVQAFVFPELEVGNPELCNAPSAQANTDGVIVGSSSLQVEKFTTSTDGEIFNISSTPGIVNIKNSSANGGQYIIFNDGSVDSNSYRKQSPSGLTYCDASKHVDVSYTSGGYLVQTKTY